MKKIIKFVILLLATIFIFTSCSVIPSQEVKDNEIEKGLMVEIEIKEGMSLTDISNLLEEEGIVENGFVFRLYVQQKEKETELLPGTYTLETGAEMEEILETITSGLTIITYKFTIPEGYTIIQVKERIAEKLPFISLPQIENALDAENYQYPFLEGRESLEGFLFPKTYEVTAEYSAKDIVEMMLSQYQFESSALDYSFAEEKGLSQYEILKIAALIEREAYVPEERELISAVIHNRLEISMPLGIDATIRYALDKWGEDLTISDLEHDSGYNTRIYPGLTPTPICNPGIASIEAALNPADVDYLYFVVTDEEKHTHSFSKTLQDHEEYTNNSN